MGWFFTSYLGAIIQAVAKECCLRCSQTLLSKPMSNIQNSLCCCM